MRNWLRFVIRISPIIASIVALGIAIFQEQLKRLYWHPSLEILVENNPPDCHMTVEQDERTGIQANCYYVRIRIRNNGNTPAENVEVFIEEVQDKLENGKFRKWHNFLPLNLVWSHYRQVYFPRISPHTDKYCDLGHILDPQHRSQFQDEEHSVLQKYGIDQSKTVMCFDFIVKPNTGTYLIPPNLYKLVVVVASANAKLVRRTIELNLTGKWYESEDNMRVLGIIMKLV